MNKKIIIIPIVVIIGIFVGISFVDTPSEIRTINLSLRTLELFINSKYATVIASSKNKLN